MALVSMRELLDHAAVNGYGIPAFNVNNLEQVQAIMEAAKETGAPVIMQASAGARKYAGEGFLKLLIQAAVESYPDIPVVMLSSKDGVFDKARGRMVGSQEYLTKPFTKDQLLQAVQQFGVHHHHGAE